MAEISPLRRRMIEDTTVRNLSPATQRPYIHAVTKISRYFWLLASAPRCRRRPHVPGLFDRERDLLAIAEPDRLSPAFLL